MGGKVQRADSVAEKRSFIRGRNDFMEIKSCTRTLTELYIGGGYNLTFLSVLYKYANRSKIRYSQNKLCRGRIIE